MSRIFIPVSAIEFDPAGNTLWVHSDVGATVLRIKTTGKIVVGKICENVVSHSDIVTNHDIHICLADDADSQGDD